VVWIYGEQEFPFVRHDPAAPTAEATDTATAPEASAPPEIAIAPRGEARPWPEFRGPKRSGIADGQGVPTTWDGESGERIAWKTEIPGLGVSSPVIWGRHVFVTTAVSEAGDRSLRTGLYGDVDSVDDVSVHSWRLFALDRDTGEVLWEREAHRGKPEVKRHLKSSHASPTPVTNGEIVVVGFGSAGFYAYDFAGKLLWKQDLGVLSSGWFYDPTYEWEFGSSPIIVEDVVVVQADVSGDSFLAAYDLDTGKERWRTPRDEISSWGTPTVLPNPEGPAELVTNAPTVRGYDASTGKLLWSLGPSSEITVASPIVAGGMAFVTGGYSPVQPIYAIRPGGRGELVAGEEKRSEAVAWSTERGGAYIPTPIVYDGLLYIFHDNGRLAIFDAATGTEVAKTRIGRNESFSASPIAADGRLFFTAESGTTFVVAAGPETPPLAENAIGEAVIATPAASDGWLVIRSQQHVFGIAAPPAPEPAEEAAAAAVDMIPHYSPGRRLRPRIWQR
jgi:outer membrane protein assembly factor BamB